jgi:hypothetical protein
LSTDDSRRELAATATELSSKVGELRTSIDQLGRRTGRAERFIALIGVSLILDVLLTVIVSVLIFNQHSTSARVDNVCQLYGFVVGSYAPQTRSPGDDREAYEQAFTAMRAGYDALGCTAPLVPPRTVATKPTP